MKFYEVLESFEYLGKQYFQGSFIDENILDEMKTASKDSKELNESVQNKISEEPVDLILG